MHPTSNQNALHQEVFRLLANSMQKNDSRQSDSDGGSFSFSEMTFEFFLPEIVCEMGVSCARWFIALPHKHIGTLDLSRKVQSGNTQSLELDEI